jgi:sec-independent protein translocase protein TatB
MGLSWSELLVVGILALIVIGPKDLPGMFRELGRFTAKVRAMGREFSRAMEQAAKETGVNEVAEDLRKVANPKAMGLDTMRSAVDKFEKWDPMKPSGGAAPLTPPPMPAAAPVTALGPKPGPATAALAEEVAAKRAASAETAARLREAKAAPVAAPVAEPAAAAPEPAPKRGGRVRKKPDAPGTDDAA